MARKEEFQSGYESQFLSASMKRLYLDVELADVYFVFGDSDNRERIPAHKNILAVGSDVFKAMFYGVLKENGDVQITDVSSAAFKEFLQFFYLSKVNLTVENAFDVVYLCKKYDVAACLNTCERFLTYRLANNNVCFIYGLSIMFDLGDLIKRCESKIVVDTKAVFGSASFLNCRRSVLSRILKIDILSCSEASVFNACMNWVKTKAKQEEVTKELVQAHLGELFYEIRFGSMTLEELADLTPSYGKLFSIDEYQDIVQMIRSKDFQSWIFKKGYRRAHVLQWNPDAMIECDRNASCYYLGERFFKSVEKTKFTANKPVLLGEIVCTSLYAEGNHAPAKMTIWEMSSDGASKTLYNKNVSFSNLYDGKEVLPKPILIKPGFEYVIEVKLSLANEVLYYAYDLCERCLLPGTDIIIDFIGEDRNRGIVRALRFNPI